MFICVLVLCVFLASRDDDWDRNCILKFTSKFSPCKLQPLSSMIWGAAKQANVVNHGLKISLLSWPNNTSVILCPQSSNFWLPVMSHKSAFYWRFQTASVWYWSLHVLPFLTGPPTLFGKRSPQDSRIGGSQANSTTPATERSHRVWSENNSQLHW